MQAAPTYRWGLGFIAMRWRHLFWTLPLAGLLIGLWPLVWKLYGPTAAGVIQVRPPQASISEAEGALISDEVLPKVVDSLNLSKRWGVDADTCASKLRRSIRREPIRGTSLLEVDVFVFGRGRLESIEIWNALILETELHFRAVQAAELEARTSPLWARFEQLESELDQLTATPAAAGQDVSKRIKDIENDRNRTWTELFSGPQIITHELPPPSPPLFCRHPLQSLSAGGGLGFGIGAILAVFVAYLLELLLPRKSRIEPPESQVDGA